jgi:hypothetical protein
MIRDVHPGSGFFHPGAKKAPVPGSGSATLIEISVSGPVGFIVDPDPENIPQCGPDPGFAKTESVFLMPIQPSQEDQHATHAYKRMSCSSGR